MRIVDRLMVLIASVGAVIAAAGSAAAQSRLTTTAEAVARQTITELDGMRWKQAAALFHPAAAERFKRAQLQQAQMMERSRQMPRRPYRDPDAPPAVAEWLAQRDSAMRANAPSYLDMQIAGVTSAAQLDSLPPMEVVARWLEAHDERAQQARRMAAAGRTAPTTRTGPVDPPQRIRTVVGGVWDDDSTTQVLIRTRARNAMLPDPGAFSVMTLRRSPQGWRVWTLESEGWVGSTTMMMGNQPTELARVLEARKDSVLSWRGERGNTVRAAVLGYPGGGQPPRSGLVEVRAQDGTLHTVEIPFEALTDVVRYFLPWITLTSLIQGRMPY